MKNTIIILTFSLIALACSQSKQMNHNQSLHDIWALVSLGEKSYEDYSGERPTIEIFLEKMRVAGNSGCNNFFADISELDKKNIKFGPIGSTRMACEPRNAESDFLGMIERVETYKLDALSLTFLNKDGEAIATFKKVD